MKAGQTNLDVGTKVQVVHVADDDPNEAIGLLGTVGEVTHPFGDTSNCVIGLWVITRGNVPPGVTFPNNRVGLCSGDRIKMLDSGKVITL